MTPEQIRASAAARKAAAQRRAAAGVDPSPLRRDISQNVQSRAADLLNSQGFTDEQRQSYAVDRAGPVRGAVVKAAQGVPFVGEWYDEGQDVLAPGQGRGQATRDLRAGMDEQYPKTALASEIAGGVAGSLPFAAGAVGAAGKAATTGGQIIKGMAVGAAGGAAEGVAQGAGRNAEDRVGGAMAGGAIGAGFGGLLGGLAPIVGKGARSIAKRVKRMDVRTIADEFGISPQAARTVRSALANDDLDKAVANLGRLGDDAMLADAGPATGALLDASSKTGGRALRTTREAVEGRAEKSGQRLATKLDDILGIPRGVKDQARKIASSTARARSTAYRNAYNTPIDYSGPGRNIEGVLSRVPSRTMNRAISEANEAMQEAGVKNMQIMAEIADDGAVTFREMPNVQQLDEIKKALGSIAQDEVDQFGRKTAAGVRASRLAGDLRDAISEAVPAYKGALRLGGDKLEMDEAFDLGKRLLRRDTTVEDVREIAGKWKSAKNSLLPVPMGQAGAATSAKDAAKQGLREHIEQTLSNVRRTITDPNTDAREAMQLVKEMSSRANVQKARLVLGKQADALFDELERAEAALALRGVVARNSDTAIRQAIQGQVRDEVSPGVVRRTLGKGGNPLEAAQQITETLAGIDPRSMSDAEQKVFAEIADALTRIRGPEAQRALTVVRDAMNGQPMRDADAELIGRLVGGSILGSGYQVGTQSLIE